MSTKQENYGLKIMRAVRDNPHFDKHEKIILYTLALHRNEDTGICNPSVDTLVEETSMRKRTMLRCLKSLHENGCAMRSRGVGRGHSTRYELDLAAIAGWQGNSAKAEPLSPPVKGAKAEPLYERNSARSDTKQAVNSAKAEPRTLKENSISSRESAKRTHRRSGKDSKPDPRVSQFFAWWAEEYQLRVRSKYHFDGGKDGNLIKALLRTFSLEELQDTALRYFQDEWTQRKRGFSIGEFYTKANNFRSKQTPSNNKTAGGFVGQ